jgi:hypothetical protein
LASRLQQPRLPGGHFIGRPDVEPIRGPHERPDAGRGSNPSHTSSSYVAPSEPDDVDVRALVPSAYQRPHHKGRAPRGRPFRLTSCRTTSGASNRPCGAYSAASHARRALRPIGRSTSSAWCWSVCASAMPPRPSHVPGAAWLKRAEGPTFLVRNGHARMHRPFMHGPLLVPCSGPLQGYTRP